MPLPSTPLILYRDRSLSFKLLSSRTRQFLIQCLDLADDTRVLDDFDGDAFDVLDDLDDLDDLDGLDGLDCHFL